MSPAAEVLSRYVTSAYFVDLTPQLQNEIIKRTEHGF